MLFVRRMHASCAARPCHRKEIVKFIKKSAIRGSAQFIVTGQQQGTTYERIDISWDHSNEDPSCTQKTVYSGIFTSHVWY